MEEESKRLRLEREKERARDQKEAADEVATRVETEVERIRRVVVEKMKRNISKQHEVYKNSLEEERLRSNMEMERREMRLKKENSDLLRMAESKWEAKVSAAEGEAENLRISMSAIQQDHHLCPIR